MASAGVPSNWAIRWAFAQMIYPVIINLRCWQWRNQRYTSSSSMGYWTSRCRFRFRLLGSIFFILARFWNILMIDACDSVSTRPKSTVDHFASAVWDKSGFSSLFLHIFRLFPLVRRIGDIYAIIYHTNRHETGKMCVCGSPCVIIVSSDERAMCESHTIGKVAN